MTLDYPSAAATGRWHALLLIVVLHLVGVLCWPQRQQDDANATRARRMDVAFVTIAAPVAPPALRTPQPVRQPWPAPLRPALRLIPALPPPDAPAAAPEPGPAAAAPQAGAEDILAQAKRDVGKIDRDLRKESLDMAQRNLVIGPSKRERLIAAAFKERGPPRVVEEVMSDGRRRSRVGNSCAYKESNGLVGARDVFRDGVKTRWGDC